MARISDITARFVYYTHLEVSDEKRSNFRERSRSNRNLIVFVVCLIDCCNLYRVSDIPEPLTPWEGAPDTRNLEGVCLAVRQHIPEAELIK